MAKNVTELTQEVLNTLDGAENIIMFDSAEGKRATLSVLSDYSIKKHLPTGMTETMYAMGQRLGDEITEIKSAVGSPLVANTVAGMTDHTRIYVYTGSETGYTAGHWYYWNGTAWTDGGVYNSIAVETDKTLSVADKAADAKVVGDILGNIYAEDSTGQGDIVIHFGEVTIGGN